MKKLLVAVALVLVLSAGGHAFDSEGSGYDYRTARREGIRPDATGHWPSLAPNGRGEGLVLKGRSHRTWKLTEQEERRLGNVIVKKKDGRYWSMPKCRSKGAER